MLPRCKGTRLTTLRALTSAIPSMGHSHVGQRLDGSAFQDEPTADAKSLTDVAYAIRSV